MSITTPSTTSQRRRGHAHAVGLLERPVPSERTLHTPTRPDRTRQQPRKTARFQRALGSKQVVSVRGRRVVQEKADPRRIRLVVGSIICFAITILAAMLLSGKSTEQAFELQQLSAQESQLSNQLETLGRDVEQARSSADLAKQAADKHMVIPDQPGVLAVENNGAITEQRPSKPEASRPIIDVDGSEARSTGASSDPKDTKQLTDHAESIPQPAAPVPGVAPYAPRAREAAGSGMGQGAR